MELRRKPPSVGETVTPATSNSYDAPVMAQRQEPSFIALSKAVGQAHSRLFPDEPYRDPKTLHTIALALTALIPIHRRDTQRELTEPELAAERFTAAGMELLAVSKRRFEAALDTLQVASLEQARVSLTLRQSPSIKSRR
jgi:hypothetical protein